jgi:hypothetical protein
MIAVAAASARSTAGGLRISRTSLQSPTSVRAHGPVFGGDAEQLADHRHREPEGDRSRKST